MLEAARIFTISLCFFYIGINIAIWHNSLEKNHMVLIGRIGIVFAIALSLMGIVIGLPRFYTAWAFNLIVSPSLIISTIGLFRFYKERLDEQNRIRTMNKANDQGGDDE